MNKFIRFLGYALIGILLLPMIAIGLYFILGGSLFFGLYVYNRKKNGPRDPRGGRNYKIISSFLFLIGLVVLVFYMKINFISWQGYLWVQLLTFVGMLPLCFYQYRLIKNKE